MKMPIVLAAAVLTVTSAGCLAARGEGELIVSAAASLSEPFEAYGADFEGEVRFSFGGSDELAAQIRQGGRPDVFASSDASYPRQLHEDGLVAEPVAFARNRIVVAVADDGPIETLGDLANRGVDVLIGAEDVPAGDYAREALDGLPEGQRARILANVRSEESDVKGIIGKLVQGAGDAGFVYASDVAAAGEGLRAVHIPDELQPRIVYGIAVVEGSRDPDAAREFIRGLIEGPGARALRDAGFLPPPPP
jgi:molybdate transport system substrate-binding protein